MLLRLRGLFGLVGRSQLFKASACENYIHRSTYIYLVQRGKLVTCEPVARTKRESSSTSGLPLHMQNILRKSATIAVQLQYSKDCRKARGILSAVQGEVSVPLWASSVF